MTEAFEVDLAGGEHARGALVRTVYALDEALGVLAIPLGPVILLYGGAAALEGRHRARIERFLAVSFIPAVASLGAIVIDGGTDAGVMRMVGEARERAGARIRIVGVAPFGKVRVPGSQGSTELAPGHTDFVLVPGEEWGAESGWFHPIASRLSSGRVVTVLVNGGPIALQEVERSIEQGGRVLVVDGTGRAADDVAAAIRRPAGRDPALSAIADSPSIIIVDVTIGPEDLAAMLSMSVEEDTEHE
jgi:hypothetical protein